MSSNTEVVHKVPELQTCVMVRALSVMLGRISVASLPESMDSGEGCLVLVEANRNPTSNGVYQLGVLQKDNVVNQQISIIQNT